LSAQGNRPPTAISNDKMWSPTTVANSKSKIPKSRFVYLFYFFFLVCWCLYSLILWLFGSPTERLWWFEPESNSRRQLYVQTARFAPLHPFCGIQTAAQPTMGDPYNNTFTYNDPHKIEFWSNEKQHRQILPEWGMTFAKGVSSNVFAMVNNRFLRILLLVNAAWTFLTRLAGWVIFGNRPIQNPCKIASPTRRTLEDRKPPIEIKFAEPVSTALTPRVPVRRRKSPVIQSHLMHQPPWWMSFFAGLLVQANV